MKNKIIFSLFVLTHLVVNSFVNGSVFAAENALKPKLAISPPRLEMYPAEKSNESITVLNLGDTPMHVEVSTQNWDLNENNKFRALEPTEQSLDQWLILNPIKLEIPANSQQTVRLAVRPRVEPEDGEHRAMVFFKQLPDPEAKGGQVSFKVGVPVYAYYGNVIRTVDVNSVVFNQEANQFEFDLTNTGNSYVRPDGTYIVVKESDYTSDENLLNRLNSVTGEIQAEGALSSGKLVSDPVLANERRLLTSKIALPKSLNSSESIYLAVKVKLGQKMSQEVYKVVP